MADRSPIQWTDATWNPLGGCTRVDEGCRNCYAEVMAARFSKPGQWGEGLARMVKGADGRTDHRWTGKMVLHEAALDRPLRWRRPRLIFVNSTSDLFHESVPDDWIDRVFAVMALCSQHTFQVLTKRPERARHYMAALLSEYDQMVGWSVRFRDAARKSGALLGDMTALRGTTWPLPNVWLGTSISDQASADARIPELLACPAAIRFVSAEPLLGPVDFLVTDNRGHDISALRGIACDPTDPDDAGEYYRTGKLDWVICGGESGPGARPMHPDWARSLRDQCVAAGVPFFFKQWGEWAPLDFGGDVKPGQEMRMDMGLIRAGKKAAGRLLDGRTWDQMPAGYEHG